MSTKRKTRRGESVESFAAHMARVHLERVLDFVELTVGLDESHNKYQWDTLVELLAEEYPDKRLTPDEESAALEIVEQALADEAGREALRRLTDWHDLDRSICGEAGYRLGLAISRRMAGGGR